MDEGHAGDGLELGTDEDAPVQRCRVTVPRSDDTKLLGQAGASDNPGQSDVIP